MPCFYLPNVLFKASTESLTKTRYLWESISNGFKFLASLAEKFAKFFDDLFILSSIDGTIRSVVGLLPIKVEKFFNIKSQYGGLSTNAVVLVATIRALKYHGGAKLKELSQSNPEALRVGLANLDKHVENIRFYGISPVIGINKFSTDSQEEIDILTEHAQKNGLKIALNESWEKGGEGAIELAKMVAESADKCISCFKPLYDFEQEIEDKIEIIATKMYGAGKVEYSLQAKASIKRIKELGLDKLPICIAKTQKSISDNPNLKGRPQGFIVKIREVELAAGAGFIIPIAGTIMRMPGLPETPSAELIDIDNEGNISGLF